MASYTVTADSGLIDLPTTIEATTAKKAALILGYRLWGLEPGSDALKLRATLHEADGDARVYEVGPTHCGGRYGRVWVRPA
jgi:hypothetical protein